VFAAGIGYISIMASTSTPTRKATNMAAPIKVTTPIQKQLNDKMIARLHELLDMDGISEADEDWALELLDELNGGRLYTADEYNIWLNMNRKASGRWWLT